MVNSFKNVSIYIAIFEYIKYFCHLISICKFNLFILILKTNISAFLCGNLNKIHSIKNNP